MCPISASIFYCRVSPYERGHFGDRCSQKVQKSDEKGSRLAKPDPIYEALYSGNGRTMVRTIGTQVNNAIVCQQEEKAETSSDNDDSLTFTLLNSFWFMIASLLQQGTDLLPR